MKMRNLIFCLFWIGSSAFAQIIPGNSGLVPRQEIYKSFFAHVLFLDRMADQAFLKGDNGIELKNYYQTKIDLTTDEIMILLSISKECEQAITIEDEKSRLFINSTRSKLAIGKTLTAGDLPLLQDRAVILAAERLQAIDLEINLLKAKFRITSFNKLDNYVQTRFASQVTMTTIQTPSSLPSVISADLPDFGGTK